MLRDDFLDTEEIYNDDVIRPTTRIYDKSRLDTLRKLRTSSNENEIISEEEQKRIRLNKAKWVSFWRQNINLYAYYKLGINLFPYQHYKIFMMNDCTDFSDISTRGTSKTYVAVLYGICLCMLYPNIRGAVGAVIQQQAVDDCQTTAIKEIICTHSDYLHYLWDEKWITKEKNERGPYLSFGNGAQIDFFPVIDSSRGAHVSFMIMEEARLMKKKDIEAIMLPMATQRIPQFMNSKKYMGRKDLLEPVRTIYITSARYANEWHLRQWRSDFSGYFTDQYNKHGVFCSDIFLGLKYGLKSIGWYMAQKRNMTELNFRMELLNEDISEAEDSYYELGSIQRCQTSTECYVKPTVQEFVDGVFAFRKKKPGEIRLITVDLAFSDSTKTDKRDNTVIMEYSMWPDLKTYEYYRRLDGVHTLEGGATQQLYEDIRVIFKTYEADYIVIDARNAGLTIINQFSQKFDSALPDRYIEKRGLTIAADPSIHQMASERLNNMRQRCIDRNAIPVIIPIAATSEWNANMHTDLNSRFQNMEIQLPIDSSNYEVYMQGKEEIMLMTPNDRARLRLPFVQTDLVISELINLVMSIKNNLLTLTTSTSTQKKDRAITLAYANAIATKIISNQHFLNEREAEEEFEEWKLVF